MPPINLPDELKPVVEEFLKEQKQFELSAGGKKIVRQVKDFSLSLRQPKEPDFLSDKGVASAGATLGWITLLPEKLVCHDKALLIDLREMPEQGAVLAISAGLQVIATGVRALLSGAKEPKDFAPEAILHAAFGADDAAVAIRNQLSDLEFPWFSPLGDIKIRDIDKLVREGTIRELIRTFAECGYAAKLERDWVDRVNPIGRVTAITPGRACAGQTITIQYEGFGASPPASGSVADINVSLPTNTGGCEHVSIRSIAPNFFDPAHWTDSGTITVTLPGNILTGCIGFFTVPPPMTGEGPCGAGSLTSAAGMLQSVFGDQFGRQGVMIGQIIFGVAEKVEMGRHRALPCAACQVDNANHLMAGPPIIYGFLVQETGPIHPRGFVTLSWSVHNADYLEIVTRSVAGSENPHELPVIAGPLPLNGRQQVAILCTRRWEGVYVLRASNANGCTAAPLEASVNLKSGYSDYRIGVANVDITHRQPGLRMAGFAYEQQETSGIVHLPQFARAFVIEENKAAANRERIAIVIADIWTCTQAIKTAVVKQLNERFKPSLYNEETVLIAGTHTHAGPGGYSEYLLYNLTIKGFDQGVFDTIVTGIVDAIAWAHINRVPGRIFVNAGELADCGANRSFEAYRRNPEFAAGAGPDKWTDREMLLLKFLKDVDNRGKTQPMGVLNWYAIHPTSLGMFNTEISGDNKGWAEKKFEDEMAKEAWGFVAAFGNGSAGDVSGNVTIDAYGNETVTKPLGGPASTAALAALANDKLRMEVIGQRQCDHALVLFEAATQEVTGPIAARYTHVDMSCVHILGQPAARTWPAAIGVSFGAGSPQDSYAFATVDVPGLGKKDIDSGIMEGMNQGLWIAGAIAAVPIIALMTVTTAGAISTAVLTGVPIIPALVPLVFEALLLISSRPAASYIAATIGASMFPDEAKRKVPPPESEEGTWKWEIPSWWSLPADYFDYMAGHGEKPILFPVGLTSLSFTPKPGSTIPKPDPIPCPLVPHVLPLHLLRIGAIAIAGVPAEFTSTAGRRLKDRLRTAFGGTLSHVAIAGYANAYSGYVTTPEEYDAQYYEGASTLYGPHTLAAYLQTFDTLAAAMISGLPMPETTAFSVPGVGHKR